MINIFKNKENNMNKKNGKNMDRPELYGLKLEPTYSGSTTFYRREASQDLNGVDLAVTGIPLDTAVTNRPGTRFGPRAVRSASTILAWERPYGLDFNPVDRIAMVDYGDCYFDFGAPESVPNSIEAHISSIINQGSAVFSIGGDHFVSYPILKAHAEKFGPMAVIQFDAHSDTWPDDDPARMDHGTMFYKAVKEGIVDVKRSVQVGIRTQNDYDAGVKVIDAPRVHDQGWAATAAQIKEMVMIKLIVLMILISLTLLLRQGLELLKLVDQTASKHFR